MDLRVCVHLLPCDQLMICQGCILSFTLCPLGPSLAGLVRRWMDRWIDFLTGLSKCGISLILSFFID